MGRLESLTAWALGRTPFEDQVIRPPQPEPLDNNSYVQRYDEHGHPRNPETKRRERENIRAANEVMQVTGIVEDLTAVRVAADLHDAEKIKETISGLRMLGTGGATLQAGVWGVIGFRRRILAPPPPSANVISILSWIWALIRSTTPIVAILCHGKIKHIVSLLTYEPVYKSLPRPKGESMFAVLGLEASIFEFDVPDDAEEDDAVRGGEEDTLRALEGLPALERIGPRSRRHTNASTSVDEDEDARPTLISFDVDSTSTPVEPAVGLGTWSAELRSANNPNESRNIKYRKTGLTMLPTLLAAEGFRELAASILTTPLEAMMLRLIGRAYGNIVGIGLTDFYEIGFQMPSMKHLISSWAFQFIATGIIWGGFTLATEYLAHRKKIDQPKPASIESDSD
ncbi:hypothetical protein DSL72_004341 [Monilinia vaccinii-corymbosi]|uniref:Uncharacterized protein n=1 Tax=Monilinia vaccinii-corymbosi TaxID=61207 RepID=A0A8A3NWE0_9HELO|nr:hypothetical protein DSL72_004341 [Monilinia vaccinii-corymbosi]